MAGDVDNPRIWLNGDVYAAGVGATLPTNTTTALNAAFEALGLLSEDGVTESRSEDVTEHYAWGGILVRTTRAKHKRTIKVIALEDNAIVHHLANPGSLSASSGGVTHRTVKVPVANPMAFVVEVVDGDITLRKVIPRGEVTEVGDEVLSESAIAMRELTITVYPDEDGILYHEYSDDPGADDGS